jgi:hypothetical protein
MNRAILAAFGSSVLLTGLVACTATIGGPIDTADGGTSSGSSGTTSSSGSTPVDGGGSSSGAAGDGGASSSGGGDAGPTCTPISYVSDPQSPTANELACGKCVSDKCCGSSAACLGSASCLKVFNKVNSTDNMGGCANDNVKDPVQCEKDAIDLLCVDAMDKSDPNCVKAYNALTMCQGDNEMGACADSCGKL